MTTPQENLTPDFLRMQGASTDTAPSDERGTGHWYGWSSPNTTPELQMRLAAEIGRVEPQTPRYNNMRKNFSAIVPTDITIQ